MKTIIKLSETDIREAIGEKFGCEPEDVVFDIKEFPTIPSLFYAGDPYLISASFVKKEETDGKEEQNG